MQYHMRQMAPVNDRQLEEMRIALRHALNHGVTNRQKEILLMYYYDNKTMPEIADELGIAKQNVSKSIKRALANIKKDKYIKELL